MKKKYGPWIIKESNLKYKNPWIEVREDKVIKPDGKPGIYGVVKARGGVSILPIDDEGFVYLTKEFHYAIGEENIEVVSGARESDETPLVTAKRELKEELGIEADEWTDLGFLNPLTSVVKSPMNLFLARRLKFKKANPDSVEIIEMLKLKFEEAVDMVMKDKITHGSSCVLILKAHEYLNK